MPLTTSDSVPADDRMRPACPLELIPDRATRERETNKDAWTRIMPHLPADVRSRLAALPEHPRRQLVTRILAAERKKERIATATPTPSPKQRREAQRNAEP